MSSNYAFQITNAIPEESCRLMCFVKFGNPFILVPLWTFSPIWIKLKISLKKIEAKLMNINSVKWKSNLFDSSFWSLTKKTINLMLRCHQMLTSLLTLSVAACFHKCMSARIASLPLKSRILCRLCPCFVIEPEEQGLALFFGLRGHEVAAVQRRTKTWGAKQGLVGGLPLSSPFHNQHEGFRVADSPARTSRWYMEPCGFEERQSPLSGSSRRKRCMFTTKTPPSVLVWLCLCELEL